LAEYIPLTAVETLGAALVEENAHGVQNSSRVTNVHDEPPALGGPTVMFGMSDLPDEQRHGVAEWSPSSDGHVLIIGAPGSGKSAAIATIAEVSSTDETGKRPTITNASAGTHTRSKEEDNVIVVDGGQEPARFWDILAELHTRLDAAEPRTYPQRCTLVTIDDLDAIISRFEDDHRVAVIDRLARLLREGPRRNLWVVASAQRITPAIHALAELMPHTLRLRFGSRQDFMLSGGSSVDYNPALPPGGGLWKGVRVQVALGESRQPVPTPAHVTTVRRSESLVIATTRPGVTTAACTAAGWNVRALRGGPGTERELLISDTDRPIALIGTVEEWQSRWGALVIAGANATVLLDGCSLSDYRQLTHTRELPPPLVSGSRQYWRVTEGGADRVLLPDEADHENDGW
jgi:S-DNA-T family DNA segregation ATPase FtsK/SpoIIIE